MNTDSAKQRVRDFIDVVWVQQNLDALPEFWTDGCVNHAAPSGSDVGLASLRTYHEQFAVQFGAFSDMTIDIVQQVAEDDRVVTQLTSRGRHSGEFAGVPATGRTVSLVTIRIDRFADDKIAEHWSVADVAGLFQQLKD